MNPTTVDDSRSSRAALRSLVLQAAEPGLAPAERAMKAREAGAELADVRDLARVAGVMPGRLMDQIRAHLNDPEARERVAARDAILEARAVALDLPSDMPGLIANSTLAANLASLGGGMPLIRQVADVSTASGLPMIPAMPSGTLIGETLAPGSTSGDSATLTVSDSVTPPRWSVSRIVAEISSQCFDFFPEDSMGYLDQLIDDAVDRRAETDVAALLVAAGTSAAAGSDLPGAIDTAESLASAALLAPADLVLVSPTDLPKVRRAVAASWQVDPHPTLLPTMGLSAGKVIVTGRTAFHLIARPIGGGVDDDRQFGDLGLDFRVQRPGKWAMTTATWRDWILSVRLPTAVRVVTL